MPPWRLEPTRASSITMRWGCAAFCREPPSPAHAPQPRPKDKLRVGCIGAGGFARGVIFPHLRSSAGAMLESVATSTGAAAASARTGFGFTIAESPSELLANPNLDAVFILTRHNSHAAYVKGALERGKCVFVEKPLAIDREQLEMVRTAYAKALAEHRSPFLMVGFNRRFSPLTEKLKNFFAGRSEPMLVHIRCNAGFIPREQLGSGPGERRQDRWRVMPFCRLGASCRGLPHANSHRRGSARRWTLQPRQRHGHYRI